MPCLQLVYAGSLPPHTTNDDNKIVKLSLLSFLFLCFFFNETKRMQRNNAILGGKLLSRCMKGIEGPGAMAAVLFSHGVCVILMLGKRGIKWNERIIAREHCQPSFGQCNAVHVCGVSFLDMGYKIWAIAAVQTARRVWRRFAHKS